MYYITMVSPFSRITILFGHYHACPPEWSWIPKRNNWQGYTLWLVLEGEGCVKKPDSSGGKTHYALKPGACLAYRMEDDYLVEHNPVNPISIYGIHFQIHDSHGRLYKLTDDVLPEYRRLENFDLLKQLMRRTIDLFLLKTENAEAANTFFRAALAEYIHTPMLQPKKPSRNSGQAGHIIGLFKRNPRRHFSLGEIAAQMHCSPNSAMRLVKRETGMTPMALQNSIKVETAKEYLHTSSLSLAELADLLGYSDAYYFSRIFKKFTGVPPGRYRSRGTAPC